MHKATLFALMVLVCGISFAQGVEEYCATERAEGESCYQNCCASLGYAWGDGGCLADDAEYAQILEQCDYCTESFIQCRDYYNTYVAGGASSGYDSGYSSGSSSSSGGCCSGFALLALISGLFAFRK